MMGNSFAIVIAMLLSPPTKPIINNSLSGFSGRGKKMKSSLSRVLKGEE